jgi:hypothetical protein
MNRFEPFIYLLIVAAILLLNKILPWITERLKDMEESAKESRPQPAPRPSSPAAARTVRAREPPRRRVSTEPIEAELARARRRATPPPTVVRERSSVQALVAGRGNLRRAVIAMTVLGPCRAQQQRDEGF